MSGTAVSAAGFGLLLVAALLLEVRARRGWGHRERADRERGPVRAAEAVEAALRTTPGRVLVLVAWVWLGVHFLAR
ncbi:DUF6186 family protein [Geodermatophilus marinus]|uniref:DUF6186 family protein n=1 Tax=Geodermatophilus sp. LHW52908 TaxID=2303986 RepID=UPI000E3E8903|nr:DUF6186 family protein [Geodermatophilus sp. LHW52908]RFU21649.1 hypothetical protein D0Z06_10665 [Geodermatophilus sp. LHW52908]